MQVVELLIDLLIDSVVSPVAKIPRYDWRLPR